MDKITCPGKWSAENNKAMFEFNEKQLRNDVLAIGESFRSPSFSVKNPILANFRFQLRVYPAGQHCRSGNFIVYLVLVECPTTQLQLPKVEVTLLVVETGWTSNTKAKAEMLFDWTRKPNRFVGLAIPWYKLKRDIQMFSIDISVWTDPWMNTFIHDTMDWTTPATRYDNCKFIF